MRYQNRIFKIAGCALLAGLFASPSMAQEAKDPYKEFEGGPLWISNTSDLPGGTPGTGLGTPSLLAPIFYAPSGVAVTHSFKGVTQYDLTRLLGGSFIPPDTMGAVGKTQYMETANGVYAIYDKATGAEQAKLRADTFWNNAGGAGFKNLNGELVAKRFIA